jgi:type IV pilus assembly protein PilB
LAMTKQASDIHIEPQATMTVVRIRVDGVLRELETVPRALQNSLVSRIKILSDMDIAERRARPVHGGGRRTQGGLARLNAANAIRRKSRHAASGGFRPAA